MPDNRERLVELAERLESVVAGDLQSGRAGEGTVALLSAANELRRRTRNALDGPIAEAVAAGMSLRSAAASFGVTLGHVRGAVARSRSHDSRD
jgi:hypothetical protein